MRSDKNVDEKSRKVRESEVKWRKVAESRGKLGEVGERQRIVSPKEHVTILSRANDPGPCLLYTFTVDILSVTFLTFLVSFFHKSASALGNNIQLKR